MKQISFFSRLKIVVGVEGVLLLASGIADVFIDTTRLDNLIFHSLLFHLSVFIVLWLLAPFIAKYIEA
jgi:hypothetical protein